MDLRALPGWLRGKTRLRPARAGLTDWERLFAAWLGLAVVMVGTRWRVVMMAESDLHQHRLSLPLLLFAPYQDIFLLSVLGWASWLLLGAIRRSSPRRAAYGAFLGVCLVAAAYCILNAEVYHFIRSPLTYRLIALSDHMHGIDRSVKKATTSWRLLRIIGAPFLVLVIAGMLCSLVPGVVRTAARKFHTVVAMVCLAAYVVTGRLWTFGFAAPLALSNPHWKLLASIIDRSEPFVSGKFGPEDQADFLPIAKRGLGKEHTARLPAARPHDVLLVVMESVGARYLQLDGAPWQNTPQLSRMALNGANFDRIYVSFPLSSDAMVAMFCSVFPYLDWNTTLHYSTDLRVPGLAQVLAGHGYRTAFMSSGSLEYDNESEFIRGHGFGRVDIAELPEDSGLLPMAVNWIQADRSRPFFLTLWTLQTHHPYVASSNTNYQVADRDLNRYLNAIAATDSLIGRLADRLQRLGLADDTVLAVTGDHGEGFAQHGHKGHGWTVYEEEVRVPILIVNRRLFPKAVSSHKVGEQIDLGPTLLNIVGFDPPGEWQGTSLFAPAHPSRAYLFAGLGDFQFGLVDGDFKYIYDSNLDQSEAYDLSTDSNEWRNLLGDPHYSAQATAAHRRLAAWLAFQNSYLAGFMRSAKPAADATASTQRAAKR